MKHTSPLLPVYLRPMPYLVFVHGPCPAWSSSLLDGLEDKEGGGGDEGQRQRRYGCARPADTSAGGLVVVAHNVEQQLPNHTGERRNGV